MKIAIVTGASRGIGNQIARDLCDQGIKVIANYNKSENDAMKLQKEYPNIDIFKADISDRKQVKELFSYVINTYGKIDILVNNAGICKSQIFQDVTDDDWNSIINTNLYSAFCMTQECIPSMINQKNGCIINISSIWGLVGASCETIYSISKAGLDAMTKSLAKELGPSNIRVNSIAPGFIDTDMNKTYLEIDKKNIIEDTPLCRIGKPEDISKCALWLINDSFTTGQIISINGGWVIN